MRDDATRQAADTTLAGMGFGTLAYALFSVHDAGIKWLVALLPVWQVLLVRSLVIVIGCLAIGRAAIITRAATTPLRRSLLLRGAITLSAWICYYTSARTLPLAQMTSLYFAAPILVTLMAAPLLGERVTPVRWACVGLGFLGVLAATDPFGVSISVPTMLALTAAALWGYGVILMRKIARRESSLLQMLVVNLFFLVATGIGAALTWRPVTAWQAALILGVGVLGGCGQFCLFEGARRAPAAVMATVEYTALLGAFVLGFLIWGDVPAPAIWVGAVLIVMAGTLLMVTERQRMRRLRHSG